MGHRRGARPVEIIEILTDDEMHRHGRDHGLSLLDERAAPSKVAAASATAADAVGARSAFVALLAIAALVIAGVVVSSLASDHRATAKVPTTTAPPRLTFSPTPAPFTDRSTTADTTAETTADTTAVMSSTGGTCSDDRVPFHATFLPIGWTTNGASWSGTDLPTGGSGEVRAVHGPIIPAHGNPVSSLVVLGVSASIAPVDGGYSVEFVLGAPSDRCDHWALVASVGVAAGTLERIAEGMSPFVPRAQELECQRAYPQPEPELGGHTVIGDSVALPTSVQLDTVPAHLPTGTLVLFARETLQVKAGAAFTIAIAPSSEGRVALDWQGNSNTAPVTSVTVRGCDANTQWISFFGGFWVMSPQCATLLVDAAGVEQQVKVGIGTVCS